MPTDIKGYRVFIASPGGLEDERRAFHETLNAYNESEALHRGALFVPTGWEITLGGIGRPQGMINELVRECDYFVLLLWDRWGTPPHKPGCGKHTSGTEEEFDVAMECFADDSRPMREVVVLFKAADPRQIADPGEQLQKVLAFKKKLEAERNLLFEVFDAKERFEHLLRNHLGDWMRDHERGEHAKRKPEPSPDRLGDDAIRPFTDPDASTSSDSISAELLEQAESLADQGKLTEAEALFAKAISGGDDPDGFNRYGHFLRRVGRLSQALGMFNRVLDLSRHRENDTGQATALGNLGLIYETLGDWDQAERMQRMAMEIDEKLGDAEGLADGYGNLAAIYRIRGDLNRAEEMYCKALEIHEKLGRQERMAIGYGNLGVIYQTRGDLDRAEEMHRKAMEIDEKVGDQEGMARHYGNLGVIHKRRGDLDRAEEMHLKSIEIAEKLGDQEGLAASYCNLGVIHKIRGDLDRAEEMHRKAREIDEKVGDQEGMARNYGNLGVIHKTRGELDRAEEMLRKAMEIHEKLSIKGGLALDYMNLGMVAQARAKVDQARDLWQKARELFESMGIPEDAAQAQALIDALEGNAKTPQE